MLIGVFADIESFPLKAPSIGRDAPDDDLWICCRTGNLARIQYLVEVLQFLRWLSVSPRSEWNWCRWKAILWTNSTTSTLLLCSMLVWQVHWRGKRTRTPFLMELFAGHYEVVKYLLDNGARCEANTFDGERCLYAALTPNIRQLLLQYKTVIRQTDTFLFNFELTRFL